MDNETYLPKYTNSWALVIGINKYKHVRPLSHAENDAKAIAEILIERFGFHEDRVKLLVGQDATKAAIMEAFLHYCNRSSEVNLNDRILFYFAGHGDTLSGKRGETGFLVPVDGKMDKLESYIRWDELTRYTEMIKAKHVLFFMDACYGGLATTRSIQAGSVRFLDDLMKRESRQVITAGKADETVSDANGPLPGHSIFTGHLLQALRGEAKSSSGLITAYTVMSYVYDKVANDSKSQQTPHYGSFDGDGDFVLYVPNRDSNNNSEEIGQDVFVEVPVRMETNMNSHYGDSLADTIKEYISDEKNRIRLDDLAVRQIKKVKSLTTDSEFPLDGHPLEPGEFPQKLLERLNQYDLVTRELRVIAILIAHWGGSVNLPTLSKIMRRSSEVPENRGGILSWEKLRWFPSLLLIYSAGMGAIATDNYENLHAIFYAENNTQPQNLKSKFLIINSHEAMLELKRKNVFKQLSAHEKHHLPLSEYLYKLLQPQIDDLLFTGFNYSELFDQFEIFQALVCADLLEKETERGDIWGPIGRFGWKHNSRRAHGPYKEFLAKAALQKSDWAPLKAGFFSGSYERFEYISAQYEIMLDGFSRRIF